MPVIGTVSVSMAILLRDGPQQFFAPEIKVRSGDLVLSAKFARLESAGLILLDDFLPIIRGTS